ncbi:MAG: ribonuclease R [Clostridia bacterium]
MENRIIEALRREGKPTEPDTLIAIFEEKDKAALAISRMLADGRLLLTRKRKLALPEQTGLVYGRIQGNARGFAFFLPEDGRGDMFIPADAMHGAMHGDKVWVRQTEQVSRGGNPEAEVSLIALRAQSKIVGAFEQNEQGGFVVPDDPKLYMDVLIRQGDAGAAKTGDKVVALIISYPDGRRPLTGKITEVLGNKQEAGTDILSVIRRLDLPDSFTKASIKLAKSLNIPVDADSIARREDMRGILTITIDGEDARDLDDAISLSVLKNGNFLLGVHIADVSEYVAEKTPLDKDAYERGTSVYFPDRVLPMLPKEISNGVCSLNAGEDKLTLSCMMEIDASGKVVRRRIAETVIKTAYRMTYEDVNAMFSGDAALKEKYAEIMPMLAQMRTLMEVLNARRVKRGSIDFDLDEAKIVLDKDGKPTEIAIYERGVSNRMIEEFMLIANETVAQHVRDLEMPFMYRVHETPDKEKLTNLNTFLGTMGYGLKNLNNVRPSTLQRVLISCRGTKEENIICRVTLRSLKRARYCESCLGHFGLAADSYCHFTSPIRRYPDLVVHRILKELLHGELNTKRAENWTERLPEMARHCSDREQVATEAERAADDLKKCEYMQARIGNVETGLISGVIQYGFFVQLSNTVEGMVRVASIKDDFYTCDEKNYRFVGRSNGRVFRLGDEVQVKIAGVDIESANVDFELYDTGKNNAQAPNTSVKKTGRRPAKKKPVPVEKNGAK